MYDIAPPLGFRDSATSDYLDLPGILPLGLPAPEATMNPGERAPALSDANPRLERRPPPLPIFYEAAAMPR